MLNVLLYGILLSISLSTLIIVMLLRNPRLLLHSYPEDVRAVVAPKTEAEKRESACWMAVVLSFMIAFPAVAAFVSWKSGGGFLETGGTAFGVVFLFNLTDWLVLDWLIFCTITPEFAVLPGTAGMSGYKDYRMHFRGFLVGSVLSAALGTAIGIMVIWI